MKKCIFIFLSLFISFAAFAAEAMPQVTSDEELDYAEMVASIKEVRAPYLRNDYVIFTSDSSKSRYVGIAFDFENFKTIHSFRKKKFMDMDYNEDQSLYFYILKLPKNVLSVNYRLIIDGLWTTDPMNQEKIFSAENSILLSHFDATREIPAITEKSESNSVHFVYRGKSGQNIRLGGSFTNWDSWIYQMKETAPGLYSFDLPLPPGKYEYAFYSGITSFPDHGNPQKCYTEDGKIASLLIVD